MKTLFALALTLVSTAASAAAPQVECYERAFNRTNLDANQRVQLCRGAKNNAPVDCYELAFNRTNLDANQRVQLCKGAADNSAVQCYEDAFSRTNLDANQRVLLCTPITN